MTEEKKTDVEQKPIDVDEMVKSGKWQTFEFDFTAQFDGYAVKHAVIVVAAPDYKAALGQFGYIINQDRKQLVALVNDDNTKDVAFLNLSHADFVALLKDEKQEEKKDSNVVQMPKKKCGDCDKEKCGCQMNEEQKDN